MPKPINRGYLVDR